MRVKRYLTIKQKKVQFLNLIKEFDGRCVRCGLEEYCLDRDHIKPKYQNGSDHINNIQPLCAWCNASKGKEKFNWKKFRRKYGWIKISLHIPETHPYNNILPNLRKRFN